MNSATTELVNPETTNLLSVTLQTYEPKLPGQLKRYSFVPSHAEVMSEIVASAFIMQTFVLLAFNLSTVNVFVVPFIPLTDKYPLLEELGCFVTINVLKLRGEEKG